MSVYSIGQAEINTLKKKLKIAEDKIILLDKALRYSINNDMDDDLYIEVMEELEKVEKYHEE